ncbi:diaminobutyrate acetyltransferase [Streptomyces clavuligerus]|nr:diaminobutyrate acetyltransferase [Streptomyces clavuligerus]ANW18796.1 diaminobutyrate acetyltransferase [Streptomyces clavuligerus]AXU13366.1 diaminobutyrate acetyltransferase [Streptomyces clavuligerus]EDY47909.1 L-2,4-diaminobutyric acid acetyltransferase [Streptomyces clavuligerus]MBY6303322.1 diaminobutyrate acetyltransferase [Streptomyces clavuligerus]QCS06149.1 diaminobutyrate acetyltransferase [Streptomyces clavuligerus]
MRSTESIGDRGERPEEVGIAAPSLADGGDLWRIARDSESLDLNSPYSYLIWCRDFSGTSLVARAANGTPVAFLTGYIRPDRPDTYFVWQIAVDRAYRGHGLGGRLLDAITDRVVPGRGITTVETTVTPDNTASDRLFTSYARRRRAPLHRCGLLSNDLFPDKEHQPEILYRIGPMAAGSGAQEPPCPPRSPA